MKWLCVRICIYIYKYIHINIYISRNCLDVCDFESMSAVMGSVGSQQVAMHCWISVGTPQCCEFSSTSYLRAFQFLCMCWYIRERLSTWSLSIFIANEIITKKIVLVNRLKIFWGKSWYFWCNFVWLFISWCFVFRTKSHWLHY